MTESDCPLGYLLSISNKRSNLIFSSCKGRDHLAAHEEPQDEVQAMLTTVVRSLVDRPDDVVIHARQYDASVTFQVQAHPSDMGKLIGVNGRTARALRIILGANAARLKRNLSLDILQVAGQAGEPVAAQE